MKNKKLPDGRQKLPYADFVESVRSFCFTESSMDELATVARRCDEPARQYAAIAEVIYRLKGLRLFDTQLATARSLQGGNIAELPTGEGKTLAAVVAAAAWAAEGRRVHLLVFNDYLARRDCEDNKDIYAACGVSCGCIGQHSTAEQRRAAYGCDVTYVSAKEAGFDYLRDFLCTEPDALVFPACDAAIIDEADSILIDEGKTPLVLAGLAPRQDDRVQEAEKCVAALGKGDVEVDKAEHLAWLTDAGIDKLDALLGEKLYDGRNLETRAAVENALEAHYLLTRDVDYLVKDGAVQIIEPTTGRTVLNKRYPDLLHRAVEVKEGLTPAPLTLIYNSITMQHFVGQYKTLAGMTGTIASSADEVEHGYGLLVDVIGPHTPCIRCDLPDVLCPNDEENRRHIVGRIAAAHKDGQPVLVGTTSVAESEELSAALDKEGILHVVLNAKNDEEEAGLIARAGLPGRVTISTNMAGRGVDIRLGGPQDREREAVVAAGGLLVLGTGINTCLRIDNQLRGRSGRQGDPGESQFYISMASLELVARMSAYQQLRAVHGRGRAPKSIVRGVQRQMDSEAAAARFTLQKYAFILETERRDITAWRQGVLTGEQPPTILQNGDAALYERLCKTAGRTGAEKAERQLTLYYINRFWAQHLAGMEAVRSGIHLAAVAHKNPIDEYHRVAVNAYNELLPDIITAVLDGLRRLPVTKDGIDMDKAGLSGGTTTWTYALNDSWDQFGLLRHLMREAREQTTGENGFLTQLYRAYLHRSGRLPQDGAL